MKALLDSIKGELLDPKAITLAEHLEWWDLAELEIDAPFPVAVVGQGPPLLLLHGFDSSFLEYRRLAPLLSEHFQLFIPDLFGFGFISSHDGPLRSHAGADDFLRIFRGMRKLHLQQQLRTLDLAMHGPPQPT